MPKKKTKKKKGPICFICNKEIKKKHINKALRFIAKNGDVVFRHDYKTYGCNIDFKLKPLKEK